MQLPTLRQLEYVVAVADVGHFGRAARRCAVSQPALSQQVREVEELLGVVLFERARPKVLVTADGERVVAQARRVLMAARELVQIARDARGPLTGQLHLGVIPTVGPYFLPGLLARLRRHLAELSFAVGEYKTAELLEGLREGRLDLALLALPVPEDGLDGAELVDEPFVLAAPRGHALAAAGPVSAAELRGQRLLLLGEGHCFRDQALDVCAVAGAEPDTRIRAASISMLMRMVESGLGATLIPATALASELAGVEGVTVRAFAGQTPSRRLGLRWRASSPRGEAFRRLAEHFRAHAEELEPRLGGVVHGPRPTLAVRG